VRGVNNLSWVFSERLAHGYLSVRQRTGLRTRRLPGLAATVLDPQRGETTKQRGP
jgi:hypothetical protein